MRITFDPDKDAANIAKHGLSLAAFGGFDVMVMAMVDDRFDYGEIRYRAFGRVAGMGRSIAFTLRPGELRLISYRPAHEKEMRRYE